MFLHALRALWGSKFTPDYLSFERQRQIKHQPVETKPKVVQSKSDDAFLHYLFGASDLNETNRSLSEFVGQKIAELMQEPAPILNALPVMPNSISLLISTINGENFDVDAIIAIVQQEPAMAADLLALANSSRYKRGNKQVNDLHMAFMFMGKAGFEQGIIEVFIKKFVPSNQLYFKQFGSKIWRHSNQTANFCQQLYRQQQLGDSGYMLGLFSQLGTMVMFQLLLDAFKVIDPDASPSTQSFKELIKLYARPLTWLIVEHWQLPDEIATKIALWSQLTTEQADVSVRSINEAEKISEWLLMKEAGQVGFEQLKDKLMQTGMSSYGQNMLQSLV